MAIQFMDNFTQYGFNEAFLLNGVYAQMSTHGFTWLASDPDASGTGRVIAMIGDYQFDEPLRKVLTTPRDTVGVAVRLWMNNLPNNSNITPTIQFLDSAALRHISICVTTTGAIYVMRGGAIAGTGGTYLGQTTGPVLVANAWQHIEVKVYIHDSAGTVEVRVEGVPVLSLTGIDTKNSASTTVDQINLHGLKTLAGTAMQFHWKDFIIWDSSGSSNNDFIGPCQVITLLPDGDNSFNWTPSTGSTGYNLINEGFEPDDESSYISASSSLPAASTFTLGNLPADVTSVKAVMPVVRARKTDGGDGTLQVSMVSGASTGSGASRPITVAYTYWSDVIEVDPATAAAWTPTAVNAAKLKLDRTL